MRKVSEYFEYIRSIPKSFYFCLKYFPLKLAVKLPILVSHNVVLKELQGKIIINNPIRIGMIRIGFGYVGIFDRQVSRTMYENGGGTIIFGGVANIGHGSKISVGKDATVRFGDKFCITAESQICSQKNITFGDNVLISWQCLIMDTDWHKIIINNEHVNKDSSITIGNNVWIGCRATVLKGVNIPDNCVIAANSNVVSKFRKEHIIVGGNPATQIKDNINWKG